LQCKYRNKTATGNRQNILEKNIRAQGLINFAAIKNYVDLVRQAR
jgi:hypothetical protein